MISPRFGSMGWFKSQQSWGRSRYLPCGCWGHAASRGQDRGHSQHVPWDTQDRGKGRSPLGLPAGSVGHEPDPELSLGVCTPLETDVAFPAHRDALACVPPGGRGIFQPGTSRVGSIRGQPGLLPPPGASAGSESRLLHGEEKGVQPCIEKYLYCSLCCPWPSPARSRHGLPAALRCQTWCPQPVARPSRSCSWPAPTQPCDQCYWEKSHGAAPATGRQAAASLLWSPSGHPSRSGLQVVGKPQQLLLAVDGFQVLQVRPGGDGASHAQGLLRACQGELRSGLGSCLQLGSPIPLHHLRLNLPTLSITAGSFHGSPFTASCLTH